MKKRILAVLSAVAMCLSAISVTVNAEEIIPPDCAEETAKNENILTVSVVDYDTGELILTENDVVWPITLQAGFSVEYVLTDGTFAWGTAWEDLNTWSYGQLNPCEIDTALYNTGFGVEDFQVVDMYIPKDYFLPEDYLEVNYKESDVYHTDFPTDITVKLKKTIMGDVSDDGAFNVSDVVLLQKWLLAVPDTHLANWKAADFCEDDRLDVFDLCLMKRKLLTQEAAPLLLIREDRTVINENGWDSETYVEVLDANGFWHVRQSEMNAWDLTTEDCLAMALGIIADTPPSSEFEPAQLVEAESLVQDAALLEDVEMTAWEFGVDDYGQEDLFAVYPDGNGGYRAVELCRFGGECAWLDNAEVQAFVTMLIENGYYADESIFDIYLEWYT